ncbi:MAG: class I SAM-dependent methyltransferase [Anaerolineae bacterium]|nr:class I SAM-dependent methyltransferase [Anaerolineae bacterium]
MVEEQERLEGEMAQRYKLLETRFDAAAKSYDLSYGPPAGSSPGNLLVTWLREQHVAVLRNLFPAGAAVLDIGCGTGEEALALVQAGYSVMGLDISPKMIWHAQAKAAGNGIQRGLLFRHMAAGQVGTLDERGPFGGAFASLGTLNTEPDLPGVAKGLHELLEPGAAFVATVMNRRCLFEMLHNFGRGKRADMLQRGADWQETRAGACAVTAPAKFYTPDEFAAAFAPHFTVETYWAFPLWLPPVHLSNLYNTNPARFTRHQGRDARMRSWPGFRAWGDHFLMVLRHGSAE